MNTVLNNIIKECNYCAKEAGISTITPNVLLHVLSLYPDIQGKLLHNNTNMWLFKYLANPFHLKREKVRAISLSEEVKSVLEECNDVKSEIEVFNFLLTKDYIKEILSKCSFGFFEDSPSNYLDKYAHKITGGRLRSEEIDKYKKIDSLIGNKNILLMGGRGTGRFRFLKNYAEYRSEDLAVYFFDFLRYLNHSESRLEFILQGVFSDLGDNLIYIPSVLQITKVLEKMKFFKLRIIFLNLLGSGKVITKTNVDSFDSNMYALSTKLNFFAINTPFVNIDYLKEILNNEKNTYEDFYGLEIEDKILGDLIKQSNVEYGSLSQPGRSLKLLMDFSINMYSGNTGFSDNFQMQAYPIKELPEYLSKHIFGQKDAINKINTIISSTNFKHKGIINTMLFQGKNGCGAFKTADRISNFLFGNNSLKYYDLGKLHGKAINNDSLKELTEIVRSTYGAVLYLDNIDRLANEDINIMKFIENIISEYSLNKFNIDIIVVGFTSKELVNIKGYNNLIESFRNIVYFKKLELADLENIAARELNKLKDFMIKDFDYKARIAELNDFELNSYSIKKLVNAEII